MARLPRIDLADVLHLVIQRVRADRPAFVDDQDRRRYRSALLECSRACGVAVHAYVLLSSQVLLLASAARAGALGEFMQSVGRQYVKAFNHRHGRSGALWEGRYRSTVVEARSRLLDCIRLIEQAPVREQLVARPGDWPWSSAAHHLGHTVDGIVTEHEAYWRLGNTPFEREARHAQEIATPLPADEVDYLLSSAWRGWPAGSDDFIDEVAKSVSRPARPGARGRPRRV